MTGRVNYCIFLSFQAGRRDRNLVLFPLRDRGRICIICVRGGRQERRQVEKTALWQLPVWCKMSHMPALKYYFWVRAVEMWSSHVPRLIRDVIRNDVYILFVIIFDLKMNCLHYFTLY